MSRKLDIKEAKHRAGRFCAFRERSPNELLEKLKSWGISSEDASKLLTKLSDEKFVDEQRFANAYCNDKFEFNSWGKQKIKAHLTTHNLCEATIQKGLERINSKKYEQKLGDLAKKKWGKLEQEEKAKRKQKTIAYLTNKGFEWELIWQTVTVLEKEST